MKNPNKKSKKKKSKLVAKVNGSFRHRRNKRALSSFLPRDGILIPVPTTR